MRDAEGFRLLAANTKATKADTSVTTASTVAKARSKVISIGWVRSVQFISLLCKSNQRIAAAHGYQMAVSGREHPALLTVEF